MILYFTGTGNSRYVAKKLGSLLRDEVVSAFEYIREQAFTSYKSKKPWVFVCPTYAWRIPGVFENFIEKSKFEGNKKAYFVMTCGEDIGKPDIYLAKLCKSKGLAYGGVKDIVMPENYVAMFGVPGQKEIDHMVNDADHVIEEVAEIIGSGKKIKLRKTSLTDSLKSDIVNPLFYKWFVKDAGFWTNENCVGCGLCEQLCPLANIKLEQGKPVWSGECTHCMACICACPQMAIEYKKISVGKSRYFDLKER